ncbi:MAG: copper-binding protein [Pseudomonadota bacterium]
MKALFGFLSFGRVARIGSGALALALAGHGSLACAAPAKPEVVSAQVISVDAARGFVTLKHARIKSIDMDAMTMPFQAREPAMLEGLKRGDRVRFSVSVEGNDLLITQIKRVK